MSQQIDKFKLSIIVPIYNEESNIDYLLERLTTVLEPLQMSYEIICINDGSSDQSLTVLMKHYQTNPALKIINLSRNFGKEIAMSAGIDYAVGEAVIPIDADLQDPPELIEILVAKWQEGYDVVYAVRRSRQGESWLKRFTANNFYRVIGWMTHIPIPRNTGDFRLLDRRVVEALKLLPERRRFMKGLFSGVGFSQTAVEYDRQPRYQGTTKWNYWKLWNFALEGITSFSSSPLKIWSYIGLAISLLSFLYATFLIIRTLIFGIDLPGYASLMVVILFLGGIQLITLGIIGEYLGRVYDEVKGRPLYLVKEFHNHRGCEEASHS
jgi:glycosyltransferase involved in cell wall biosynthesis